MANKAKKILVTGAAGYIGSHTLVELIHNGYELVSIDNLSNSYASAFEGVKAITGVQVKNYLIDLCDLAALRKVFKEEEKIDGIIHFAAKKYVNESVKFPLLYYHNNLESLINVLQCCAEFEVPNLVFSSSCSVYGNAEHLPVDENCPLALPESPYAQTKVIGEQIIQDFVQVNRLKVSLLRYFNPAGAHSSGHLGERPKQEALNIVPRITGAAMGKLPVFQVAGHDYPTRDGTCIRDYIHVSDIAQAHTLALEWLIKQEDASLCEVFNLGTGEGHSVLEMINAFEKANQIQLNYSLEARRAGDVVAIYADNTKAKNVLHWQPRHSLEEMMRSAWEWEKNLQNKNFD
ncbi:MAG: UDP-glucose 4-epimerase GalE [Chitinophagales bacterium]|nr:UDP-glucose 4-epimerase GalE [Chitinophagales bacterium]